MNNKIDTMIGGAVKKPDAESVVSTLRGRRSVGTAGVGNTKKGVDLLGIVQKLSQKRAEKAKKSA